MRYERSSANIFIIVKEIAFFYNLWKLYKVNVNNVKETKTTQKWQNFLSFRVSARRVSRFFPVKVKRIFLCTGFFKNLKLCSTVFILNQLILLVNIRIILSVIRQKGESQNGCFKKKKHSDTHTYLCISEGKKY